MVYMHAQEKSKSYYKILGLCVLCQTNALREYEPLRLVWICVYGSTPISRQLRALDYEHFAPHFLGLQLSKPFMLKEQQMQKGNTYNQCYSSQNLYSHNIGYQCTRRQSSSKYLCIPLLASWQDQREILACAD
ncbi:uncharacterized protein [Pyrus communis]|uniref:uncharacterized protein isoform X2 n=1 Tax=Pyrus communis TaxID=23211 RepID=UPI0035BF7F7D